MMPVLTAGLLTAALGAMAARARARARRRGE
jgi:hypothetical protein